MKKFLCTFLALIILLSCAVTTSANTKVSHLYGDTNGDKVISITDATIIQMHLASLHQMDESVLPYADVNANGYTDIKDATLIQMYLAQKILDFPATPVDEELQSFAKRQHADFFAYL